MDITRKSKKQLLLDRKAIDDQIKRIEAEERDELMKKLKADYNNIFFKATNENSKYMLMNCITPNSYSEDHITGIFNGLTSCSGPLINIPVTIILNEYTRITKEEYKTEILKYINSIKSLLPIDE